MPVMITNEDGEPLGIDYPEYDSDDPWYDVMDDGPDEYWEDVLIPAPDLPSLGCPTPNGR